MYHHLGNIFILTNIILIIFVLVLVHYIECHLLHSLSAQLQKSQRKQLSTFKSSLFFQEECDLCRDYVSFY